MPRWPVSVSYIVAPHSNCYNRFRLDSSVSQRNMTPGARCLSKTWPVVSEVIIVFLWSTETLTWLVLDVHHFILQSQSTVRVLCSQMNQSLQASTQQGFFCLFHLQPRRSWMNSDVHLPLLCSQRSDRTRHDKWPCDSAEGQQSEATISEPLSATVSSVILDCWWLKGLKLICLMVVTPRVDNQERVLSSQRQESAPTPLFCLQTSWWHHKCKQKVCKWRLVWFVALQLHRGEIICVTIQVSNFN